MENVIDSLDFTEQAPAAPELPVATRVLGLEDGFVTAEQVSAIISRVLKFNAKNNEAIHKALVVCAAVAFDVERHKKNVQPFTLLVKGLRGADRQAMIGWIEAHAPAIWRADEAKNKRFVFNNSFKGEYDFDVLMADKWYDHVKPANQLSSTIDFREQLDNMVKRLTRELTSGQKTVENPKVLDELKALQGRLSAAEFD
jgi:hypothetical protein